jgi:hypothetical protein
MPDSNSVVSRMYNRAKQASVVKRPDTAEDKEKRAVKVLAGMKVHGSHVKQIEVNGQLLDVPTVAYTKLLEEQIRETRNQQRELHNAHSKMQRAMDRMTNEIRKLKDELANKVDLR